MTLTQRLIEKAMLYKFAFNRAVGHAGTIRAVVEPTLLAGILLKLYGVTSIWLLVMVGVTLTVALLIVGFLDIKLGVAATETSIANRYNPEIQRLLKRK